MASRGVELLTVVMNIWGLRERYTDDKHIEYS